MVSGEAIPTLVQLQKTGSSPHLPEDKRNPRVLLVPFTMSGTLWGGVFGCLALIPMGTSHRLFILVNIKNSKISRTVGLRTIAHELASTFAVRVRIHDPMHTASNYKSVKASVSDETPTSEGLGYTITVDDVARRTRNCGSKRAGPVPRGVKACVLTKAFLEGIGKPSALDRAFLVFCQPILRGL